MLKLERAAMDRLIRWRHILFFLVITLLAILARKGGMDKFSPDMNIFLIPWFEDVVANGGFRSLSAPVGDYNILYHTLICLFSYVPLGGISPVYLYKMVSILFDFLLALSCGWIVAQEKGETPLGRSFCMAYGIVLMLPTVILNSAIWGQCDSMYTVCCVLSLYWLYHRKYPAAFAMFGFALAWKLQAIFILPVFLYFYISRKDFSLLYLLLSAAVLWASGIPGYLAGQPLTAVFDIYAMQTSEYPELVTNSLSVWYYFFPDGQYMKAAAMMTTLLLLGLFLYWLLNQGGKLKEDSRSFFIVSVWSVWTCLLFLPSMHDRYSYPLDLLLVLLSFLDLRFLKYAAVQLFSSGVFYTGYLYLYIWVTDMPFASNIAAAIASLVSAFLWLHFSVRILPETIER